MGAIVSSIFFYFILRRSTLYLIHVRAGCDIVLQGLKHLLAEKSPRQIPWLETMILEEKYSLDTGFDPMLGTKPVKLMDVFGKGTPEREVARVATA